MEVKQQWTKQLKKHFQDAAPQEGCFPLNNARQAYKEEFRFYLRPAWYQYPFAAKKPEWKRAKPGQL
jgi:hypothetical protein